MDSPEKGLQDEVELGHMGKCYGFLSAIGHKANKQIQTLPSRIKQDLPLLNLRGCERRESVVGEMFSSELIIIWYFTGIFICLLV
jgi:hypothetical protein